MGSLEDIGPRVIDYGRRPALGRRILRKAVIVALILTAAALTWRGGSPILAEYRSRWNYHGYRNVAFQNCLNYVESGPRLAFDERRDSGAILVSGPYGSATQNVERWCRYR